MLSRWDDFSLSFRTSDIVLLCLFRLIIVPTLLFLAVRAGNPHAVRHEPSGPLLIPVLSLLNSVLDEASQPLLDPLDLEGGPIQPPPKGVDPVLEDRMSAKARAALKLNLTLVL